MWIYTSWIDSCSRLDLIDPLSHLRCTLTTFSKLKIYFWLPHSVVLLNLGHWWTWLKILCQYRHWIGDRLFTPWMWRQDRIIVLLTYPNNAQCLKKILNHCHRSLGPHNGCSCIISQPHSVFLGSYSFLLYSVTNLTVTCVCTMNAYIYLHYILFEVAALVPSFVRVDKLNK